MVILEVYSKCLKVKYKTCLCSQATLFTFLTAVISIVIPFVFAYNSRGFWLKHDTFYEQPDVKFRGEYLFYAITNNISAPVVCKNFPHFQGFTSFDKCSLIKARETDHNKDGKVDELQFSLLIHLEDLKMLSFYLILVLDYSLHTVCPMQMQSAIIVQQHSHRLITTETNIAANLGLSQTSPLYCPPRSKNRQYDFPLMTKEMDSYDINSAVLNYSQRNVSTFLINEYTTFKVGDGTELYVKLKVRFPEHKVYYVPGFWQVIKWAWMQYFAIYVVFSWIMQRIRNYVFENRLLLFYEMSPLKKTR